ncbi:MAG: indolepyruvate ferredoxin oxidoreductase subunit alpha [Candidatus Aminicenantes bacterium]|nr:indolepyruvate ferredoxin oxidoreductase subunit alpha [Candidatus Aminicenantes bacterium]
MKQEVLLGDEAVALGAIHAGLSGGYSYPGTPASEIMEYLIRASNGGKKFIASWSVNEKVAYEEALGVSYAGKRALVSMKHVGLNVAADPFMNSAITGANGGLVVVVADDPGMHSSQNEQDSRYFAQFAQIFCFEPSNHQEAYDMTRKSFDLSESLGIPVLIRMVTRLSHSRSRVQPHPPQVQNPLKYGEGIDWTLLPVNARRQFKILVEKQGDLIKASNKSEFNSLRINTDNTELGIIASGIAYNYVLENYKDETERPSILKITTYPLPEDLIKKLVKHVDTILVVEEGYPFIEKNLMGIFGIVGKDIRGKLSGYLPSTGELSPETVRQGLEMEPLPKRQIKDFPMAARPPQLCQGCSHADTYRALNEALGSYPQSNVFSDIGCYTLGALPPYSAIQSCVCMGASVSMAKGGAEAGVYPSVAVIGDSTFAHSGLTPLLDAAAKDTNMTVLILDNATVAMTGGQPTFLSGEKLERVIEGLGVGKKHIRTIIPLPKNHEINVQIMKEEFDHNGLSVIIAARECVQQARRKKRSEAE